MELDIKEAISGSFGFPAEIVAGQPKLMLLGKSEVYVENILALAEYKKDCIRLVTKQGVTELLGENFEITAMKEGNIAVKGRIESIRLI